MSWKDVADFVAPDAPELSEALNALEIDTPLDALALAGSPGQTIWGKTNPCVFNQGSSLNSLSYVCFIIYMFYRYG